MGKTGKLRLGGYALDYLGRRAAEPACDDLRQALLQSGSGSPARALVEARSDLTFLSEGVGQLTDLGLDSSTARRSLLSVLINPTVALRRGKEANGHSVLQSVLLDCEPGWDGDIRLVLRIEGAGGKPAQIQGIEATAEYVDPSSLKDKLELIAALEEWTIEFPMPNIHHPEPLPLPEWAWLGDLAHVGLLEVPQDWRTRMRATGTVYGRTPVIADTKNQAIQAKVRERSGFLLVPHGVGWGVELPVNAHTACEIVSVERGATLFSQVMTSVRTHLLGLAESFSRPVATTRSLDFGEVVYHRKVGNGTKFDCFDQGTKKPCSHGAQAFIPWTGVKAIKGMARRYSNFKPEMLIHCQRYPNCGLYGVDARRGA